MRLTLLDSTMHDFEHLGVVTFDGTSSSSQRDERRCLTSQDSIFSTVDTVAEVLNSCGTQTDQAVVFRDGGAAHTLFRQVQCEAIVLNLSILLAHLL